MAKVMGGHLVARMLRAEGVEHIYTLCGGHVDPIYQGCLAAGIRIIDTRHEQAAAHAADAEARLRRAVGVAVVTAGPGVTGTVTAVANAMQANSPLLVLGGAAPLTHQGRGALQEMAQLPIFAPITKWAAQVPRAAEIPAFMAEAFRVALSGRPGPVFLELPFDVLFDFIEEPELPTDYHDPLPPLPDEALLDEAAALLSASERPVIVAGTTAYWEGAGEALDALVAPRAIPTYLNGMARGLLPHTHAAFFRHSRSKALKESDLAVVIGTPLDFRLKYGDFAPNAKLIQIEPDGANIGRNRTCDVPLVGNARAILDALGARVGDAPKHAWHARVREIEAGLAAAQREWEAKEGSPVHHFRLAAEINRVIDERTTVIGDGGDVVAMAAKVIDLSRPGQWLDPGPLGCLGIGEPFALAVKALRPDERVLVISGDGSFGFNGFELESAIRQKLPFVVVVGNDAQWGQIRNPQIQFFGEAQAAATTLAFTRYDLVAEALGGHGELVEGPEEIGPAIERAFASGTVAIVNVALDPEGLRHMVGRAYV